MELTLKLVIPDGPQCVIFESGYYMGQCDFLHEEFSSTAEWCGLFHEMLPVTRVSSNPDESFPKKCEECEKHCNEAQIGGPNVPDPQESI